MVNTKAGLPEPAEPAKPGTRRHLGLVPADYAEKAMRSLLALHGDLMAEKERCVELTRSLMQSQQDGAALEGYVRLLESALLGQGGPALVAQRRGPQGSLAKAFEQLAGSLTLREAPLREAPLQQAPEPSAAEGPSSLLPTAELEGDPPRPPRPSSGYRAPLANGRDAANPAVSTSSESPKGRSADPSMEEVSHRREAGDRAAGLLTKAATQQEEGWRQW